MAWYSQKIEVQGLIYETPIAPSVRATRGSDFSVKNQVWHRDETYLKWEWNTSPFDENKKPIPLWWEISDEEQMKWYEEEIYRINNGAWIMIEGKQVFFNKWCYFFHQWFVLLIEQTYPFYKETSLEYFRFYELCESDRGCLGDCGIKGRRLGLSSMASSIHLQVAITENNTLQGVVSKTGDDAYEMYLMIKNGLENLPPFLMPELNKVTESELHIAKPQKKISSNNKTVNGDKGLNNRINHVNTAENAYDGRRARRIIIDEAAKWERINVQICLNKISDTLVVGSSVGGHVSVFSTVNKGDKGGDNFRKIWAGSDHVKGKKDKFGRTETKLKRFFIPGYRGLFGYFDKYGNSVVDTPTPEQSAFMATLIDPSTGELACLDPTIGAREYLEEERKMKIHDPELYAEQVRKYPFEWEEVFKDLNNSCHFNMAELNDQIQNIQAELDEKSQSENGRRGRFKKMPNGCAEWVDDPAGMWFILQFLKAEEANRRVQRDGIFVPDNCQFGAAGLDPYSHAATTVDEGSDACIVVSSRFSVLDPENSGMPVAMFVGRPSSKNDFQLQLELGLIYYGVKVLGERMPSDWQDYMINHQMLQPHDYHKLNGYALTTKQSDKKIVYGANPQSKDAREAHVSAMVEYALNNMHKIKFMRILKEMVHFNVDDRTDFDACMAWGYSLLALGGSYEVVKQANNENQIIKTFQLKVG